VLAFAQRLEPVGNHVPQQIAADGRRHRLTAFTDRQGGEDLTPAGMKTRMTPPANVVEEIEPPLVDDRDDEEAGDQTGSHLPSTPSPAPT
jgi:hypothetical protein